MDDEAPCAFSSIEAPYIAETEILPSLAGDARHVVYYRTGSDDFNSPPIDIFAVGDFKIHEESWTTQAFDWRRSQDRLDALDSASGPLAGYMAYEAGFGYEPQHWTSLPHPDSGYAWRFIQFECWYEADHSAQSARICSMPEAPSKSAICLLNLLSKARNSQRTAINPSDISLDKVAEWGEQKQCEYEENVLRILEDIRSGRYYELNFTQRFRVSGTALPSMLFHDLCNRLKPRRACYFGFENQAVVSLSPELFLRKTGERIATRPIKGSMHTEVNSSERDKLMAEHIMVVDLARNDIGRISNRGWVCVDSLALQSGFGGLKHLESLISGRTSFDWRRILTHTFPAASITGTPKVMVVSATAEYEKSTRGVYTGACGIVFPNGDFDFNVAIRTLTAQHAGEVWEYELGAGGAIVADSDPAAEYQECLRKVQPLIGGVVSLNNSPV